MGLLGWRPPTPLHALQEGWDVQLHYMGFTVLALAPVHRFAGLGAGTRRWHSNVKGLRHDKSRSSTIPGLSSNGYDPYSNPSVPPDTCSPRWSWSSHFRLGWALEPHWLHCRGGGRGYCFATGHHWVMMGCIWTFGCFGLNSGLPDASSTSKQRLTLSLWQW